jgi:hypothetical protein
VCSATRSKKTFVRTESRELKAESCPYMRNK